MRLTKYIVTVPINNDNFILINTLNGKIYKIDEDEYKELRKLEKKKKLLQLETDFSKILKEENIIIDDIEEEKLYLELLERLKKRNNKKKTSINEVVLVLTYNCNFSCPYCYEKENITNKRYFTKEMVDKIFEIHKNIEKISFFGGEPLLLENKGIIQYTINKNRNAKFSVMTNGYYLEEYCDLFKQIEIECIQVTLDGPEEQHNRTRISKNGEKSFEKILAGLEKALKMCFPVRIRMNVNETNLVECLKFREQLLKRFLDYETILSFELYPIFQLKDKNDILKKLYNEDMKIQDLDRRVRMNNILRSGLPIENFFAAKFPVSPIINYCEAHTNKRFFDVNGNIYSCILSVGREEASIGKFYPEYILFNKSFITRDITKIKECKECRFALLCGGGCPLQLLNNNIDIYKPNCGGIYNVLNCHIPSMYKEGD